MRAPPSLTVLSTTIAGDLTLYSTCLVTLTTFLPHLICSYNVRLPHWLNFLRSKACRRFLSDVQATSDYAENPLRYPDGLILPSQQQQQQQEAEVVQQGAGAKRRQVSSTSAALSFTSPTTLGIRGAAAAAVATLSDEEEEEREEREEEQRKNRKKKRKSPVTAAALSGE